MPSYSRIKYSGTAPGADSNTYVLFSTVASFTMANAAQMGGVHKLVLTLKNSQAGTLNTWRSTDRGVTWVQITTEAITAGTATTSTPREYLLEQFADFKLEWVNSAVAQATWVVDMALTDARGAAT